MPAVGASGRSRAGPRASPLPDAEGLPHRARAASRWSSAATPSRRGTPTPGSSPRWSPATRSSSSRTRARCCRSRSRVEVARTVLAEAGFDPDLVQLAAEADGEGLAKTLAERARGRDHRLHRRPDASASWLEQRAAAARQAGLHREGRRQHDRRRLDRRPARACWATSPSRWRSTPARCARRRRTSTCPEDGIDTDEGHLSFEEFGDAAGRRPSAGSPATTPGPSSCSAPRSTTRCAPTPPSLAPSWPSEVGGSRRARLAVGSAHPAYPDAVVRAPGLVAVDVAREDVYTQECFGPVAFLIRDGRRRSSRCTVCATRCASTAR